MAVITVPSALGVARHWVVHKDKQPFGNNDGSPKGWNLAEYWFTFEEAKKTLSSNGYDGLGFIVARESGRKDSQIIGGDLDNCRDPITGEGSAWALKILEKLNTCSAPSFSGCGYRFFCYGKLPNDLNEVMGHGPDDLSEETKERIMAAKPAVKDKLENYGPSEVWNGFELYEDGPKHLTVTGQWLPEYPAELQHRNAEVLEVIEPFLPAEDEEATPRDIKNKTAPNGTGNRFPSLSVLDVIDAAGFERSGDELVGPNPVIRSTTGANLKVNPGKNTWCNFHNEIKRGGDAWVWLACECGAIRWEEAGPGALNDAAVVRKTLEHAVKRGLVSADVLGPKEDHEPTIRKASIEDQSGTIGLVEDGTVKQVVASKDDPPVKRLIWVSDCALHIDTETSANNITEFTFMGEGAKDHRKVSFTLQADALEHQKFKTALINAFGAVNRVGKLDFETVQKLSRNTKFIRRVEVPSWNDNIPMIPGVELAGDTEFRLSPMTPAKVFSGDIQVAKDLLRTLLKTHPLASILVTAIMGAPAVARWRPDDRIAVALWAGTGTQKTTVAKACVSIYGSEYQSDRYLLKHGRGGSTVVAALEIMARAGILPQILDDVKAVDPKDHQNYVTIIHAVIEGSDKQRGKKDGGLRGSQIFRSTPIITGEVRPEEASTDARVCNLSWSKPNLDLLNEIESRANEMPIIGYHWLRFLAETNLNLNDGFNTTRSKNELEFSRAGFTTNPGRLATIYTVLMATWNLLCESPFGEVFKEATEDFTCNLTRAIQEQGSIVNSDTEVSKFLAGVNELLASQPSLFQSSDGKTLLGRVVGKHMDEGLFLLPNEILAELDKLKVFTQKPTVDSMGKGLDDAGKLIRDKDERHRKVQRRMGDRRPRGWLLTPTAFDDVSKKVETEKQQQEPSVSTNSTNSSENESLKFKENLDDQRVGSDSKRESKVIDGDSGVSRDSNVIDSGFSVSTPALSKEEVVTPHPLDGIKCKCKTVEDVINCLDHGLMEIENPVLADWLHKQGLPYIPVLFGLRDRGWKQDDATRTMHKAAEAST